MDILLQILLGQVPEALFFALFMIFVKDLREKRGIFITLMIVTYVILLNLMPFSFLAHILYMILAYAILKLLYKEKSQITDVFLLMTASIIIMLISALCYFIMTISIKNILISTILAKILLFVLLFATRRKLPNIQKVYTYLWNRDDKLPKPIKSVTFRCINVILFNIMFYMIYRFTLFAISTL